ncbi:dienelactone hydrolase family protein [Lapidilactobacillus luobeiensis]|uniref:dienelactone hydrolase family protein n=1 Tax=Lapidilactobacillus luobeiensis TaxID=2950371 RepID=UPI0021C28F6E|nr:dienelactone hydrolase family protein [Lapidilactobacillus luobeiensis]
MVRENRQTLIDLLGKNEDCAPSGRVIKREKTDKYFLETLALNLNRIETVPALFAYPQHVAGPVPLVIYNHSHGGNFSLGKRELLQGTDYLQRPAFLDALIEMGYAVGCIDMFGFGERQGKKESELVKEFLVTGHTLWGLRIFDDQQFLTYLLTRPEVDTTRIATIGMSMGGLMSWWLAAVDPRVKVTVDISGQVDLETLIQVRGLDHHGFYYYVPNLLTKFTTLDIQKMIVPRPRLSLVGKNDGMCPNQGVQFLDRELRATYQKMDAGDNWRSLQLTGGHQETSEMRSAWQVFLKKML